MTNPPKPTRNQRRRKALRESSLAKVVDSKTQVNGSAHGEATSKENNGKDVVVFSPPVDETSQPPRMNARQRRKEGRKQPAKRRVDGRVVDVGIQKTTATNLETAPSDSGVEMNESMKTDRSSTTLSDSVGAASVELKLLSVAGECGGLESTQGHVNAAFIATLPAQTVNYTAEIRPDRVEPLPSVVPTMPHGLDPLYVPMFADIVNNFVRPRPLAWILRSRYY
ncbi:hypothetical protein HDU67_004366 [Dinochytrium kinnereticum]|nr:hypothetical protein HDU67_004366 [Dinochytrium kinnereticum]